MGEHFKVSCSTKWRLGENVAADGMLNSACYFSHLFVCLLTLALTTFEQQVSSTQIGYGNVMHYECRQTAVKKRNVATLNSEVC